MRNSIVAAALGLAVLAPAGAYAQDGFGAGPPSGFGGLEAGALVGGAVGGTGDVSTSGVGVGGYAGYNFQNGPLVGGVEGDAIVGSINGDGRGGTLSHNAIASARVRGGWAFGNVLAYGTIGPAWGSSSFNRGGFTADKSLHGVVYGAGGEFAINRSFSARAELRHYDLGTPTYYMPGKAEKIGNGDNFLLVGVGAHF